MKRIGLDISVLSNSQKTGIETYSYELIKALFEINKSDEFILFGFSTIATYSYLKNIDLKNYPNVSIKVIPIPAKLFRRFFLLWQRMEYPTIENFIGKVDIYHSFNWYLPPQNKGKVVASVFDTSSILFPEYHHEKTSQLDKLRLLRISNKADLVITISENSKKDFLKSYPDLNIEVIFPAMKKYPEISQHSRDVLNKFNVPNEFILSVSTLEPRKNLEGLILAYKKSKVKLPLVLIGAMGWKNEKLIKLISNNKSKIITTGYINENELAVFYKNASFFVYPSFYEGFGIPVLEAMSFGVPVITSNSSSLPEVAGEAGLYIDPKNISSLSEAIYQMFNNHKLRADLSKKGLKRSKKFSWIKSAIKLNKLYQSL